MAGWLVLVVGPSGAGKDSVLRDAARELKGDERFVFPRRVVTRQADANLEDHDTNSEPHFEQAVIDGKFMLHWGAHGNFYGIPIAVERELAAGRIVCINVSRAILAETATRFSNLIVVEITAPIEMRVARILMRGRESQETVMARALRDVPDYPKGINLITILNDGTLRGATIQFARLLRGL
jgi:ribose 1,5-bisphosphokinase